MVKGFVPKKKFTPFMKDLAILMYATNECHTTIRDAEPKLPDGLSIDLDTCTWTFDGKRYQIGEMRHCEYGCRWGVIGVFNRHDTDHLDRMVRCGKEATRERMSFYNAEYS